MAEYDLWTELQQKTKQLDYSVRELRNSGTAYAEAEKAYKIRLREYALGMKADGMAVGMITMKDTGEELRFKDKDAYLSALAGFFDCMPDRVSYKTLTDDPATRMGVDDLVYGLFGEKNPHPLEHYLKPKAVAERV